MERAGDPEAMAVLALRLDDLAGELDVHRALTRAAVATAGMEPPPLIAVRDVASWLRGRADDLRRRALDLLSADRPWRRTGVFDHLVGVARHGWSGVVDGVKGIGSGLVTAGHILVEDAIEPGRLATAVVDGGPKGAGRELGRYADESLHTLVTAGRNLEALDPQVRARRFAHELRGDGFWAATEDAAHDSGEQVPAAVLIMASAGAGAVVEGSAMVCMLAEAVGAASDISNASVLASPAGHHPASHDTLLLSVDAGGGRRVGLDPGNGQFVVFEPQGRGFTETSTRWSGLGHDDRETLQRSGIVDRHGHLRTGETTPA